MAHDRRRAVIREIGIVIFAALVYFGVRIVVEGSTATAVRNAERILRLERRLGIDIEHDVQAFVLDEPFWRTLGNVSYVWLHWPLLIAILIVLFGRDRARYRRLRRALCASGAIGLVLFWLMPTSPPRFMPGFEGTVSDAARTHYLGYPLSWANRYAAFPSFHVGWTLIACLALAATLATRRARAFALVPAILVALSVVTTGNHYVLDALAGTVIAVGAYWWSGRRRSASNAPAPLRCAPRRAPSRRLPGPDARARPYVASRFRPGSGASRDSGARSSCRDAEVGVSGRIRRRSPSGGSTSSAATRGRPAG